METRLTEFSYGYCVTEEFANGMGAGLKAAPYFPSLYIEGKAGSATNSPGGMPESARWVF
jgi:hypothetical protein